jgi:hypothetical protein
MPPPPHLSPPTPTPLAEFFLKKFRGAYCDINDLPTLDPEVHWHLMALRHSQEELPDLGLTFTITDSQYGVNTEVALKPGGAHIAVTSDNVIEYIHRWVPGVAVPVRRSTLPACCASPGGLCASDCGMAVLLVAFAM